MYIHFVLYVQVAVLQAASCKYNLFSLIQGEVEDNIFGYF